MSSRNLEHLFNPRSVALIGASDRPRVDTLRELFDAAEILSRWRGYVGPRLAIVTNGGGPAVLATDALVRHGGELAELSAESVHRLDPPSLFTHRT